MEGIITQRIVINSGDNQNKEEDDEITSTHTNKSNYNNRSSSECFVVDIDYLSLLGNQRSDIISTSSTTIHRNLSRKGSSSSHQIGGKTLTQTQKDTTAAAAAVAGDGFSAAVGGGGVVVGADHNHHHCHESSNKGTGASLMMGTSNKQPSIIVVGGGGVVGATTGTGTGTGSENINNSSNTKTVKETVVVTAESSRWRRYNSIRQRYSSSSSFSSWMMDPRRILLLFATLSSIGTIILIYFTLSMAKLDGEDITSVSHSQAP